VLLLLAAVLATVAQVVLTAGTATAAPRPAAPQEDAATVELVSSTPTLATPGSTVTVTVEVTNGTDTALDGTALDLGVSWRPLTSREDLAAWADDDGADTAVKQLPSEPVDRLAPGESARVSLELDVDALGLGADAPWGPREMSVALVRGGTALDVLHTYLLYAPEGAAPGPLSVSVAAPVTGPAVDPLDPEGYDAALGGLTASGGRLARVLDAAAVTATSPGLSLAVDPALVSAAAGSDDPDARAWATRLTGQAAGTAEDSDDGDATEEAASSASMATGTAVARDAADVAVLPGYDPDLEAVAHADPSRADVAAATGGEAALGAAWQRPEGWDLTLAWPEGRPDARTLSVAHEAPVDQVVVASGLAPVDGTPASARTAVETPSGKVSALVADAGLSTTVASLTDGTGAPTAAEAAQRLLADTALLAVQQQDGEQENLHLLAALPRDWSPDPALVAEVLGALDDAAWADVVPLAETVDTPASRVQRDGPARNGDDGELEPASVRRLLDSQSSLAAFSTVAADPVELSGDTDQALVAPLAVAARTQPETRARAVDLAVERSDQLQQGISVADRSNVTLVSDTGKLPVMVTNELPVDATVTVVLRPDASRLVVESRPTVVVPAGTSQNVHVPVRAIGSGDVDLQVEVLAPSGMVVSGPTSFSVKVRAGWETAGTAVVAAAVALLFLAGIWRTVRRGRSSTRTTDEGVADAPADPQVPDDGAPPDASSSGPDDRGAAGPSTAGPEPDDPGADDGPPAPASDPPADARAAGAASPARPTPAQATETDPS